MENMKNVALTLYLIESLNKVGSWCGETNIQKTIYLAQALTGAEFNYDFILYKHGPFSFELRSELSALRAEGFLILSVTHPGYGPRMLTTRRGQELISQFPKTMRRNKGKVEFIINRFGNKNVAELERLGTACLLTLENPNKLIRHRANNLTKLKPHIDDSDARVALKEIDAAIAEISPRV